MAEKNLAVFDNFTGGLNTDKSPYNLMPNELITADNVDYSERGSIKKRKNINPYNDNSFNQEVERLFEWRTSDGSTELMAIMEDEFLYRIKSPSETEQIFKIIGTHISFVVINEYLYFVDGNEYYRIDDETFNVEPVPEEDFTSIINAVEEFEANIDNFYNLPDENIEINSETVYLADDPESEFTKDVDYEMNYPDGAIKPLSGGNMEDEESYFIEYTYETESDNDLDPIRKCRYLIRHPKSLRIFAAGNPDDPSALYYSEFNQPSYFKNISKLHPTTNDGAITGLYILDEMLLVFFHNSAWAWRGIDPNVDAVWEKIPIKHGAYNHRTIEITENALTFVDNSGIYAIAAGKGTENITDNKVSNIISKISNKNNIHSIYDSKNHRYMLAYSDTSGRNDKILTLDWNMGAYAKWTGLGNVNDFCLTKDGDLLMATKDYIMILNQDSDYKDIDFVIKTKKDFLQNPYLEKVIKKIFLSLTDTENTNVKLIFDKEEQNFEVNSKILRHNLFEKTIDIQVEIENNSKEPITLFNWGIEFKPVMTYKREL